MEYKNIKFADAAWATNRRRRANTPAGAKQYANAMWLSMPGSKVQPEECRPSVLIRAMLSERRRRAVSQNDPHWLWDAKTNTFTENELLNIAAELEKMELAIVGSHSKK